MAMVHLEYIFIWPTVRGAVTSFNHLKCFQIRQMHLEYLQKEVTAM
jgi:hypothetical protein